MAEFAAPSSLILLAQSGDRSALERLFTGIQRPLFAYLVRLTGREHLAEDILQEVFVLVWRKLGWLRDPALFRPWVYRIATREGLRRLRREQPWFRSRALEETCAPPPEVPRSQVLERLPILLSALSAASRAVVALHYEQGLTLEETATALDLPVGTVKSRLTYGLTVLRQQILKLEQGYERP